MKRTFTNFLAIMGVLIGFSSGAQTFIYPIVYTPETCVDSYALRTGIRVIGVQLNNIYFDDGTNGSFGFEMVLRYGNIFEGNVVSTGNFYTYKATLYTVAPNVSGPIANNGGNIPLVTDTSSNVTLNNNPSYNGSASALGLTTGVLYTDQSIIDIFGYDSTTLEINLPCIGDTVLSGVLGSISGAPLPITLERFKAIQRENVIHLTWNTFSENNSAGFQLEKSRDGKNWFPLSYIRSMAPKGNSSEVLNYETEDRTPFEGDNYYRILEVDLSGNSKISAMSKVNYHSLGSPMPVLYPNPAKDRLVVGNLKDENAAYELLNTSGQVIKAGRLNEGSIEVSTLANGFYVLSVEGHRQKCVVLH